MGKLVVFSKGAGYSKGDLKENGTPIILYGRLYTKYETVISDVDTFADAKENSVYSKGGEVIVPASGETAEDISIASVVEKSGVLLGGDLNVITPANGIDSAFLAISISNGKPHNDMAKMAQGKSVVHLHNLDLAKIDFPYPSYKEQQKIRKYFSNLDHLIPLHQRKLNILKSAPKFLLGIVWEQRKLGSIVVRESDLRVSSNKLPSVEYEDVVAEQGVLNKDIYEKNVEKKGILFTESEILYGKLRPYLHNWLNPNFIGVAVGDWWVLKPKYVEKDFLYALIQLRRFDEITNQSSGSKMPRADWNLVVNSDFDISKLKVEQKKIGTLFSYLDTLITLHQRQQNLWKFVRKGVKLWIILTKNQILKRL